MCASDKDGITGIEFIILPERTKKRQNISDNSLQNIGYQAVKDSDPFERSLVIAPAHCLERVYRTQHRHGECR